MNITNYITTLSILLIFSACSQKNEAVDAGQITSKEIVKTDSLKDAEIHQTETAAAIYISDTLTQLSEFIAGKTSGNGLFSAFTSKQAFKTYATNIEKKWHRFDSTKLKPIMNFVAADFLNKQHPASVFYPFSGPDILYSSTLFPSAKRFTMIGLEPVGTLPVIDDKDIHPDSIHHYFEKINSSLYAILNFSFFRTVSMKEDLRNEEVDGTIHLLLLFLNRTGHAISSVKPFYIDSAGNTVYVENTQVLKNKKYKNASIEIVASKNNQLKTVTYTSTDLSNGGFSKNKGLQAFILRAQPETTYLKGASYLMHKATFSDIRNLILKHTNTIVQDDSGIGISYILKDKNKWQFDFYGTYTKPINMFTQHYQPELDSLYKLLGTKPLGFGLGYNYRDKNSNFMIIKKQS